MSDNSKTAFAFLLGAAAGVAIGFFLASDNKEELISDLNDTAKKVKVNLDEEIEKGKKFVDDLKSTVNDLLEHS
ncbi:MAG TPA: YtxH domain-containing protein [Chitinophagales bacterium]|nr:YtxH domain-containing protein [Chitinophagales bacterium]